MIKIARTGSDDFVPDTTQVVSAFARIAADYQQLFALIFYSGIRVNEAVILIQTFARERLMTNGSVAKYPLSLDRDTKKCNRLAF